MTWQHLADLALHEQRLVETGSWPELLELQAERERLIATLTSPPPLDVLGVLVTARERSLATEAALRRALAEQGRELDTLARGRRAVVAYGGGEHSGLEARA
jgi:hypothetical protein